MIGLIGLVTVWLLRIYPMPARVEASGPMAEENAISLPDVTINIDAVVASGLNLPVQVTHAGDASNRLFVVEQGGKIKIIKDGDVSGTPFLDIGANVITGGERGLLGLAFHPDFETNGYFYVNYTRAGDGATVVARYTVSANPDVADPTSAVELLTIAQPYANHNGGQLLFGPDGYLYIGAGDGGSGGDPENRAQNIESLLGKLLRIDVDGGSPYAIPSGNPYAGLPGRDEIWALGLRNPWRFSFDRATGDLYIGDVGQNQWEEIDYQASGTPGGLNFGWRCKEGNHLYNFSGTCPSLTLVDPIAEYDHTEGSSVTGGFVYRGNLYPALVGRYFYADASTGKIWSLYQTGPGTWSAPELELASGLYIVSFGEDESGELYVVDYGGTIRRLADANGASPVLTTSTKEASSPVANPGERITYTIGLNNTGGLSNQAIFLVDTIPAGLAYVPGSLAATFGVADDSQAPTLHWQGALDSQRNITITYQVDVTGAAEGSLVNQAQVTGPAIAPLTLAHSLFVPRVGLPTTVNDFFLPGTQPGALTDKIPDPQSCDFCHTAPIYDRWRGSMMSQSARDPLLWAALAVANIDAPNAGDYCLRCHAPKGWLEERSHPADGSALQQQDIDAGVACEICHRMVDPIPAPSPADEAATIDAAIRAALTSTVPLGHSGNAMLIVDPQDRRRGPFAFEPDPPHPKPTLKTDFLGQSTNYVTESRLCGACHNVDNPVLSWDSGRGQYWPNGENLAAPSFDKGELFPIETTFDEWLNSQYASTGVYAPQFAGSKPNGVVGSCQDCHMRRITGQAAEGLYDPVDRNCSPSTGCLPEHEFVGGNTWAPQILQDARWRLDSAGEAAYLNSTTLRARSLLQRAATMSATLATSGAARIATVRVTNETGHKLPTGYPEGRRMWLNLRALDGEGTLLKEWGAYDPTQANLTEDTRIYEAKQGITPQLAAVLDVSAGESFHFILNNTVIKDNRIPPRGYTVAGFDRPGLRPVGATYADGQYWDETVFIVPAETRRIVATLYYQTSSRAYIDFLKQNGGIDGLTLSQLWEDSKSPAELMAVAVDPPFFQYLPQIFKGQ